MAVIHPPETFKFFTDLLALNVSDEIDEYFFTKFIRPRQKKEKQILKDLPQSEIEKKQLMNKTIYQFYEISQTNTCSVNNKRKTLTEGKSRPADAKFKQMKLDFMLV
jgi:hypothetical protein